MHFYDFEDDDVLIRSLISVIDTEMGDTDLANDLRLLIQDKVRTCVCCSSRRLPVRSLPSAVERRLHTLCAGASVLL